jgi:hypothetical protein
MDTAAGAAAEIASNFLQLIREGLERDVTARLEKNPDLLLVLETETLANPFHIALW